MRERAVAVAINDLSIVNTLKASLSYNEARARTLAVNVANADTPGYVPKDLQAFDEALRASSLSGPTSSGPVRTHEQHFTTAEAAPRKYSSHATPDSETTIDGNAVVLEEQIVKVGEARMAYETALGLYQKSLSFLRMAVKSPSR